MPIYAKCINNVPRVSLQRPDDSWIELDGSISDKVICENGQPKIVKMLDYTKEQKKHEIRAALSNYIYKYYPLEKQQQDLVKKEFWATWLLTRRKDLTLDSLGQKLYDDAANILDKIKSFNEIIATYPTTLWDWSNTKVPENIAWSELLKISVRIGWTKVCTYQMSLVEQQVDNAKTVEQVSNIHLDTATLIQLPQECIPGGRAL